jgi:dipeptidyl aminopeptidase/acylaminoacyl peptidase
MRRFALLLLLTAIAVPAAAQRRAITFDDLIDLKVVGDPQVAPGGRWVAYTVNTISLQDNRGTTRIWLADLTTGESRVLTAGPGTDRSPRWSPDGKTLAFISTRQGGSQIWTLPLSGGEAQKVSSLADGVNELLWMPDGKGFLAVSDVKWPADQEIDRRNGQLATDARIWTDLFYRHWDEFRAGRRQHVFRVEQGGAARDLTPLDRDAPTIGTGGDGDVVVSPDGREIAVAMHPDSSVADNTNVDVFVMGADGSGLRSVTAANRGADNTPRYSPDGQWLSYLSLERAGFEADRGRLMLRRRNVDGGNVRTLEREIEATKGWDRSVGSYAWCPDSKCIIATVENRGRVELRRIAIATFQHSSVATPPGVNTNPQPLPDGRVAYVHQSNTQPAEVWVAGKALTHHNDQAVAALDLPPLEQFGFKGALGDSVFGWVQRPPGAQPGRRYPVVYLVHGGPQGAWVDNWHARWNYQLFASRGWVVAAVNFHGSTGYGQKFTDAITQHWGDYPFEDLMKGMDAVARMPFVDSTRTCAAGASYGGYMIFWMAGHTDRFKCFVAHDGVFNTVSMGGSTEELWFTNWEFGGSPYANREMYERWSPLNHVKNWKTPMLVVHGQNDYRVDVSEGFQAFTAARVMGVPAKFLYFPDEGHWVLRPRNRRVWWSTVLDWLNTYLESPRP